MINSIRNIGHYLKKTNNKFNLISLLVKPIESDKLKYILEINVCDDSMYCEVIDFKKEITQSVLYFTEGRTFIGGGLRLDFFDIKNDREKSEKSIKDKINSCLNFCEISTNRLEEISQIIIKYLEEKDKNTFIAFKINGKYPEELFEDKFLKYMLEVKYKLLENVSTCHLCGNADSIYNTTTFRSYTNDKSIYGCINEKEKEGFGICSDCLEEILIGKEYLDKFMTTYWQGNNVMFLPYEYDEKIKDIYEQNKISKEDDTKGLIKCISQNESDVFIELGKANTVIDVIFYKDDGKSFAIDYEMQSIENTKFTLIGKLLRYYDLKIIDIVNLLPSNISIEGIKPTKEGIIKILGLIFYGRKMSRIEFFRKVNKAYKCYYLNGENIKYRIIDKINKLYNFMCELNCLEGRYDILVTYTDYNDLFEKNNSYFNTNEKKAWFILGRAYNTMIYYISKKSNNKEGEKTSLEKTFFFSRKFNFDDFVYFCNMLTDKAIKYGTNNGYFALMIIEAKELMATKEGMLNNDEAKYLFFWGMDAFFKKNEVEIKEEI